MSAAELLQSPEGLVAVRDADASAGALVYWSLAGSLDPLDLAVPWEAAGLDPAHLPETPSPQVALRRAVHAVSAPAALGARATRRLVRSLEDRGAVAVVEERLASDDLEYATRLKARLNPANQVVVSPADHPLAAEVRRAYEAALGEVSSSAAGDWLVAQVRRLDGLSLRDSGGFYYLPPRALDEWRRLAGAVRKVSRHRLYSIPAMRGPDAVEALLAAVSAEAEGEAREMEGDVAEALAAPGALGRRALETRAARCAAVEEKVGRYEALLGASLAGLRERLDGLRVQLSAALLAAMPDEEPLR